ncbi:uncharacterized protein LOC121726514 [Aricia agestis]|uniref:uncharacterized protein LOC121726514 n=1 Tax=Aricia agestis TaxID=91739 RepID=UPI001C202DF8|nr:uncharacterized protein LOC121726514 [Aricia agestis]
MAPDSNCNRADIPNVGHTRDRSFCVQNGACGREVCVDGRFGRGRPPSQCILSPVAVQIGMDLSSTESDPQGTATPEPGPGSVHTDCPEVGQSVLAGRCSPPCSSASIHDSGLTTRSPGHDDGNSPSTSQRPAAGGLANFGWQEMLTDWTEEEQKLLMSSWRASTIKTYRPAWDRWKKWCESNSINFKYPNADQVARYLAHLHCDIGLSYKTILVHKSVISTFTHLTSHLDLSSNFFIKHILKAISVARETPSKPPIWNPRQLIVHIGVYNLDENNLYQVSRHTATLLLLASGRRVHDLTLLRVDNQRLIDEGNTMILWPVFGSKTDNYNYRQSGWRIKAHPIKRLNIIFWIKRLIDLGAGRRNNITHLFITARGDVKPASRTVIGNWVKSLLSEAGIQATPGSVRSAVASLNFVEQFPIDQILKTGNWRCAHTFKNYYQKEIINCNNANQSVSLSNYFDPVN